MPSSFVAANRLLAKISSVISGLSAPSSIISADMRSTSAVVFVCMNAPVSVMIVVRMQVAISGVIGTRARAAAAARRCRSKPRSG